MIFICNQCGYEYDPETGDIEVGIEPGVDFDDLSEDWTCPLCGASKYEFEIRRIDHSDSE